MGGATEFFVRRYTLACNKQKNCVVYTQNRECLFAPLRLGVFALKCSPRPAKGAVLTQSREDAKTQKEKSKQECLGVTPFCYPSNPKVPIARIDPCSNSGLVWPGSSNVRNYSTAARSKITEISACLCQAQLVIRTAPDLVCMRIVLTVIMPKANRTYLVSAALLKRAISATWAMVKVTVC
jgi:hypothetical protein